MRPRLRDLLPANPPLSLPERVRSGLGAFAGILLTGLVCRAALGPGSAWPALVPPMGASAVLLFGVPASPLAQPWPVIGGNIVAALVGVTAAMLVADPFWAAALAIGIAIGLMMTFRCVHPPSGAVALTAILGGPAIRDLGYGFVLWPVLANSVLMVAAALVYNNLAGRRYPHVQPAPVPASAGMSRRIGFTSDDLDAVLRNHDQLLDITRGDLEEILHRTELQALARRSGRTTCAEIMSADVVGIAPDAALGEAFRRLRAHRIKVLPVVGGDARVLGIVTQTDLLDKAVWDGAGPGPGLLDRLGLARGRGPTRDGRVEDVMTRPVETVRPETTVADAVRRMSDHRLHHLPVVDAQGRLVGIVAQSDLIVALLAEAASARDGAPAVPA